MVAKFCLRSPQTSRNFNSEEKTNNEFSFATFDRWFKFEFPYFRKHCETILNEESNAVVNVVTIQVKLEPERMLFSLCVMKYL